MTAKTVLPHLHVILLCEDYGSRLWPIAREQEPSCAAPVEPGSSQTLLANTVERLLPFTSEKLHVVTTLKMAHVVDGLLANNCKLKTKQYELLTMPTHRGTALSVALACARVRKLDPAAVVLVSRTDQHVEVDERWDHAVLDAYQVAKQEQIAVLGSVQETKCADWTYIRKGKSFPGIDGAHHVRLFTAEQTPSTAKRVCTQGAYWYTGCLVSRAAVLMGEMVHVGDLGRTKESAGSHRIEETANFLAQLEPKDWLHVAAQELMQALPNVSLDKAVLAVRDKLVLIACGVRVDALSTLEDLDALSAPDRDGNRTVGEGTLTRCHNTTVYAQGTKRKVAMLGLRDTLVIELDDMTLVVAKDQLDNIDDIKADLDLLDR